MQCNQPSDFRGGRGGEACRKELKTYQVNFQQFITDDYSTALGFNRKSKTAVCPVQFHFVRCKRDIT
jgi:hypothetical protein